MRNLFYTLAIMILIAGSINSQDLSFEINQNPNKLDCEIDTIDMEEYETIISSHYEDNEVEITYHPEDYFINEYPSIFANAHSCYKFKSEGDFILQACKTDSTVNIKGQSDYEFIGQYCNFGIIYVHGYEYWEYISVDLTTGYSFQTLNKPKTFDCKFAISIGNYYGIEEVSIIDLVAKNRFDLAIENANIIESKPVENGYFLKLKIFGKDAGFKYLRILIK
ncbi:MAG TPA: hypothetical protein PK904_13570 [Bacteroidales bacterium]|nr:hypothetical protein [Bacteroidales bacterium]